MAIALRGLNLRRTEPAGVVLYFAKGLFAGALSYGLSSIELTRVYRLVSFIGVSYEFIVPIPRTLHSNSTHRLLLAPRSMLVFSALPPPKDDVWYLAYGSNLYKEKFIHDRGIVPLSTLTVTVPGWVLAMDSAGFPYSEPSFASISPVGFTYEKAVEVIGTAYKLTPDMYGKVLASEGGGIAYAEVEVRAKPLPPGGSTGAGETKTTIVTRTLVTVMRREARPSTRYMGLIRNGAREAHMPADYQQFLARLPVYRPPTTRRGRTGAWLFQSVWNPVMSLMEKITKPSGKGDERGDAPLWVIYTVRTAVFLMWFHHDYFHAPIWGRGDGTEN